MCRNSFCVTGAILSHRFQKMTSIFRGRRNSLKTSIVILRGRRSASDVSCCLLCANPIVRAASSGDCVADMGHGENVVLHCRGSIWCRSVESGMSFCMTGAIFLTLCTLTLYTPHSTPYTLHLTLHTLHSTPYTLHFAFHTCHSPLYTLHCPPYIHFKHF